MWGGGDNFGGGGFMSTQSGAGQFGSPAQGDKPKSRRSNNIIPLTIKQLLDCQEENVMLGDTEAHVITIVGLVTAVEHTTTKLSVHLDDQTGTIECVTYVGTSDSNVNEIPFVPVEGTYGRVVGQLRSMKGSKYVVIFKFIPVTDLNEMTAHLLEVIQVPMRLRKLKEAEALKTGVGGGMNNSLSNSMMVGKFEGGSAGMMGGTGRGSGPTGGAGGLFKPGFSATQNMVFGVIQSVTGEQGISKDEILRNMKGKVTMKELEKTLEDLSNEGHIYSTIDDEHFRSTD